MFVNVKNAMT